MNTPPTKIPPPKITLGQKLSLLVLGVILTVAILEAMLRFGGWFFFTFQERANRFSLDRRGDYRILCLGESTTALGGEHSYPRQLETILNSRQKAVRFTVINKGIPSGTSTQIISHLPQFLEQYNPHIVVAMIGINDGPNFPLSQEHALKTWDRILMRSRTYKFFKLLVIHIQHKILEIGVRKSDANLARIEKSIDERPNSYDYTKLAGIYRVTHKYHEEKIALVKAIKVNPRNYEALAYLGLLYKREAEFAQAIECLKRSIQHNPEQNDILIQTYAMLGECYQLLGEYPSARQVYEEAMAKNPRFVWGLGALGNLYMLQEKYPEAAILFQRQLDIDPGAVEYYQKLAQCYLHVGERPAALRVLELGIKKVPQSAVLYAELGACLLDFGRFAEAEIPLKKSLSLNHDDFDGKDINIYDLLYRSYIGQGKTKEAKHIQKRSQFYAWNGQVLTTRNYLTMIDMLKKRRVPLIAMQYPLRDIQPLRQMLMPHQGIILVDNKDAFKKGLDKEGYSYYFTDRFAGDFGHCTAKGNQLIAENLAETIFKNFAASDATGN